MSGVKCNFFMKTIFIIHKEVEQSVKVFLKQKYQIAHLQNIASMLFGWLTDSMRKTL